VQRKFGPFARTAAQDFESGRVSEEKAVFRI